MFEKFEFREYLIASIAVKIPTRAVIPKAIIRMVMAERVLRVRIEIRAILRFSVKILFLIFIAVYDKFTLFRIKHFRSLICFVLNSVFF